MNKGVKIGLTTVLTIAILVLAWVVYRQIMSPLEYQKELAKREAAVIDRIVQIRAAEQAFKLKNNRYTGSWDSLLGFVMSDSLVFERKLVDEDDSVAMAQLKKAGRKNVEKFMMAARDTIFSPRKLTDAQINDLRFVPFAAPGTEYILNAGMLTTESKVVVPVFEAKAPYKVFMHDLDEQELINLIDNAKKVYYKYPGIQVGDVTKATNDAGNWE